MDEADRYSLICKYASSAKLCRRFLVIIGNVFVIIVRKYCMYHLNSISSFSVFSESAIFLVMTK